jgi:hypothetical protein
MREPVARFVTLFEVRRTTFFSVIFVERLSEGPSGRSSSLLQLKREAINVRIHSMKWLHKECIFTPRGKQISCDEVSKR